jgi:UDP-N-acetylglucosamine 2-epimerase (non-hydrolysing)
MGDLPKVAGPIFCIVGARPNYMKMAPLIAALRSHAGIPAALLIHTGQHYDSEMNERLFQDLQLPAPDLNLEVGSGTHAVQTAEVMKRFEPVLDAHRPACVVVVGDVNSTLACSLVAAKKQTPIVHVEAGLRSFDRAMPEEINRVVTDQLADLLYTTERSAHENLAREGVASQRVHFVGNLMIDSLLAHRSRGVPIEEILRRAQVSAEHFSRWTRYGVVTLHRPSNVDHPDILSYLLGTLRTISERIPLIVALHPRTRASIERFHLQALLNTQTFLVLPPQGYLEMIGMMSGATLVLTDSGGIQEETTALGVPCLTLRENTERPITVEQGTNTVVGRDRQATLAAVDDILAHGGKRGRIPELWDGRAALRIADDLAQWLMIGRVYTA